MELKKVSYEVVNPKTGTVFKVDLTQFSAAGIEYLIQYGATQQNDVHSGIKVKDKKGAALEKAKQESDDALKSRLDALKNGEIPKGGGGGKRVSPETLVFAKYVVLALGNTLEWKERELVTKLNKGECKPIDMARRIAARKLGRKAKAEDAKKCLAALNAKVSAYIEEERAKAEREKADMEEWLSLDEPTVETPKGDEVTPSSGDAEEVSTNTA